MTRSTISGALLALMSCTLAAEAVPSGPGEDPGSGARPSNALNPAISVNALLLGTWRDSDTGAAGDPAGSGDPSHGSQSGLSLQEAEVAFSAAVDPYFKADLLVAFADVGPDEEGFEVDIEEAYVTALALPRGFGLRAGKMLLPFGRHNLLHTHRFPFITAPLISTRALGEEGLNEPALELSWLVPLPWYGQVVVAVADGRNEMFSGSRPEHLAYFAHARSVWDLSEAATLEIGASGLHGKRGEDGRDSASAWGLDVTWKHRPLRRTNGQAFELAAELMRRSDPEGERLTGGYAHVRWQATRRTWLQGRYERSRHRLADVTATEERISALVAFAPSEFSLVRLEYARLSPGAGDRDHQLRLQLGWSIGPHPAHSY